MNTDNTAKQHASLFDLDGVPKMSQAIPLALQHVVAMIVGRPLLFPAQQALTRQTGFC